MLSDVDKNEHSANTKNLILCIWWVGGPCSGLDRLVSVVPGS